MLAFAANSVLARLAFATAGAEALSYTGIRLAAGAMTLALLLAARHRAIPKIAGTWAGAAALLGYALFFSIAYLLLGAGTGALILFGTVQIGILAIATIFIVVSLVTDLIVAWLDPRVADGGGT